MEISKAQRLHDTLQKLAPRGNHGGLGSSGLIAGGFKHRDNGLPKNDSVGAACPELPPSVGLLPRALRREQNCLYQYFVKPGHFKTTFADSDEEDDNAAGGDKGSGDGSARQEADEKSKRRREKEARKAEKAAKKLAKKAREKIRLEDPEATAPAEEARERDGAMKKAGTKGDDDSCADGVVSPKQKKSRKAKRERQSGARSDRAVKGDGDDDEGEDHEVANGKVKKSGAEATPAKKSKRKVKSRKKTEQEGREVCSGDAVEENGSVEKGENGLIPSAVKKGKKRKRSSIGTDEDELDGNKPEESDGLSGKKRKKKRKGGKGEEDEEELDGEKQSLKKRKTDGTSVAVDTENEGEKRGKKTKKAKKRVAKETNGCGDTRGDEVLAVEAANVSDAAKREEEHAGLQDQVGTDEEDEAKAKKVNKKKKKKKKLKERARVEDMQGKTEGDTDVTAGVKKKHKADADADADADHAIANGSGLKEGKKRKVKKTPGGMEKRPLSKEKNAKKSKVDRAAVK